MLFRSSRKKSDACLILDIGNASLAGSIVCFEEGVAPRALFTLRVPLSVSEHAHPEKLQATLLNQLHEVLNTIHLKGFEHSYFKDHEKKLVKVLCVCASPWYASKTKKVSITNQKPFFITKAFLEDVLTKESEAFSAELSSGTHGEEFKSGVVVMEKTIVDATINGYSIHDPVGQKTTSCDVTLYLGINSKTITSQIEEQILKFFEVDAHSIIWHSFPLVASTALRKIFPRETDYLLCDVTGEVTDITRIVDGVVSQNASFPSGKFFIVRKLMQAFNVPAEVALSFLHLFLSDVAAPEIGEKIQNILVDAEREWSIYLEDALLSFGPVSTLSQKVYVTSDTDVAPLFVQFLKTPHTDTTTAWRRNLTVVHLSEEVLSHFYISENHLTFDECMALDSIFLSTFH